jgi:hypothetical protein
MAIELNDDDELATCIDCGAAVFTDVDRSFTCSADEVLCFDCARRRGGVFDEHEDRWVVPPDVGGLADERRPHA